jgi:hypothetical protein
MSVVVMNRYIGGTPNEVVPNRRRSSKKMARNRFGSAGSLLARSSASGYLFVRYSDWAAYARYHALSALAEDAKFKELAEHTQKSTR